MYTMKNDSVQSLSNCNNCVSMFTKQIILIITNIAKENNILNLFMLFYVFIIL